MLQKFRSLPFFILIVACILVLVSSAKADEIDDLQNQINQLNHAREMSIAATKPLQGQLTSLQVQLQQIQATITSLSGKITQKEQDLEVREEKIATQQVLLDQRVRAYYIRSYYTSPLIVLFSSENSANLMQELTYNQATTTQDKKIITDVTKEIVGLVNEKAQLEKDKQRLASFQAQVDQNAKFLGGEIQKAQAYQSSLSSQIAQLSAQQQALIAAKQASLNLPVSASTSAPACVDDRGVDPGFSPAFAFFTYGVPNRVGLNQYGAKGRAEAGQSYTQILDAYYTNYSLSDHDQGTQIHVTGTNNYGQNIDQTLSVEDYLKHIYEMPASWSSEALKAQAVAARSYVLAATNNGSSSICPSDSCQEFKQELNSQSWIDAVNATAGKVMTQGGSPIKAWFSSTHGGYVRSSSDIGWSATSYTKHAQDASGTITSFSDLQSLAYDKGSPWFYCDWGARAQYSKTAWLKSDELADIVNVILLAQRDSSTIPHLSQTDGNVPDTWDSGRVKQELQSRGVSSFSSVSSVSISADFGGGNTTSVSFSGDAPSVNIDGAVFKQYFNVRAPANIEIVGPLYNIEKR